MTTETIVILVVLALLIGSLPTWSYSRDWGYAPSGLFTILGVILVIWLFFGNDTRGRNSDFSKPVSHDIRDAAQEVGDGLRDAGRDLRRTVVDDNAR